MSQNHQFGTDDFVSMALKNLPKGRTQLSSQTSQDDAGEFRVETYKTVEQTETITELEINSENPIISEFVEQSVHKRQKDDLPSNSENKKKTVVKRVRTE